MTVQRIHPKAPVMLIFISIFTCLPNCINLSNIKHLTTSLPLTGEREREGGGCVVEEAEELQGQREQRDNKRSL